MASTWQQDHQYHQDQQEHHNDLEHGERRSHLQLATVILDKPGVGGLHLEPEWGGSGREGIWDQHIFTKPNFYYICFYHGILNKVKR